MRLAVTGDYAYVPTYWRAKAGGPDEDGVPTSYYASVQFVCRPTVVDDDAQGKTDILAAQLADMQPEGRHAAVATDDAPYGRMLLGIRGLRLAVLRVEAKFKTTTTTRWSTDVVSPSGFNSKTAGSTPGPPSSSYDASPR